MSVAGKVVVVTGAAGGMGRAFSRRFARGGFRLGLLDRDPTRLRAVADEIEADGHECVSVPCDVTDESSCRAAVDAVCGRFGGIDVLVNNAGITHRSAFADTDAAVFRRVMEINFFGSLYCTKAALSSLVERRGLIIVVSSVAGFAPLYGRTGYAASKHALHGLFGSLRTELARDGVGVLIVCPGFTATGLQSAALDADGQVVKHPQSTVGRIATPESVADAVWRAAERRRRLLVLSGPGRASLLLQRVWPALGDRLMARALRRELER